MKLVDITGQVFDRLTVIREVDRRVPSERTWLCLCACGNETAVNMNALRRGLTKSCGCIHREMMRDRQMRHGLSRTRVYVAWQSMMTRCFNPRRSNYANYGGRGITVCERWRTFDNFLEDMGQPPEGMSLDRIDNEGHYQPGNCRWTTAVEQANNRRPRRRVKLDASAVVEIRKQRSNGVPCVVLAEQFGVSAQTITAVANGRTWGHV